MINKIRYNTIDMCQVLVNNSSDKLHGPPNIKNPPQENHRHFKWPPTTNNGIKYVWSIYVDFFLVPKHSLVLDSQDVPWKKKTNSLVSDSFTMVTYSRKLPTDLSRQAFPKAQVRGVMTFATWAPIKMSVRRGFQAKEKRGAVKMKKSVSLSQNVVNFN